MSRTTLKINEIKNNPNNPRTIRDDKFKKLVQSLKDFPIMAKKLRKVVVDEDNVILGGNMRFKAIKEAGLKEVHVEYFTREDAEENNRLAKELDPAYVDKTYEEQCREFIIKDNVSGGEWDWDILANEWDTEDLEYWGADIPDLSIEEPVSKIAITEEILKLSYEPKEKEIIEYDEAIEIDERYYNLRELVNKLPNNGVRKICEKRLNDFIGYKFDIIADYYSTTNNEQEREALRRLGLVFSTTEEAIRNGFALADDLLEEFNGEA